VRIALASKGIPYETHTVQLFDGEQSSAENIERNPMMQVPVLECTDNTQEKGSVVRISQSVAIVDFLESAFPNLGGSLLPTNDPVCLARARSMAEIINSGVQPLQSLTLTDYIDGLCKKDACGSTSGDADTGGEMREGRLFARRAIEKGLVALEALAMECHPKGDCSGHGPFAVGTFGPTIADACIVPQLCNARQRFGIDVDAMYPTLVAIERVCESHPWFVAALPDDDDA
jgi:maleylacetoacetate isomerase